MKVILNTERFKEEYVKISELFPDLVKEVIFEKSNREDIKKIRKKIKKLGDEATNDNIIKSLTGKIGIVKIRFLLREYMGTHWSTQKVQQERGAPKNRYSLIKES